VTKTLRQLVSGSHRLHIVYEAGPCGFTLQRQLSAVGWRCDVLAPSSIPRTSGDRVKSNRRDAMKLAHLARVGEFTPVRVPDCVDEAIRDLVRGREDCETPCANSAMRATS
jgi:transposase